MRRGLTRASCILALAAGAWLSGPSAAAASSLYGDTGRAPRCELKAKLMGVVYNERKPERSFAIVAIGRSGTRMVYVGSWLEGKRIGAILPMAIWLGPEDAACWVPLSHDAPKARRRHKKRKRKKRKKRKR